jgi:mannitol/fructose-specific phosphotransferase system IIA component (Ntr-type)
MVPLLRCRDAAAVTAELCSTLQRQGKVNDLLPFYNAIISYEALNSTATSPAWALPHAFVPGLPELSFALGRTAEPLVWFGQELVQVVFLFAVPESESAAYESLVSGLAKLGQDRMRCDQLLQAPDSEAMFALLEEIHLPRRRAAVLV